MGKHGKRQPRQRTRRLRQEDEAEEDLEVVEADEEDEEDEEGEDDLSQPSAHVRPHSTRSRRAQKKKSAAEEDLPNEGEGENGEREGENGRSSPIDPPPSKFSLYQQSVQSPKGDISYMRKFFLMYVGGRTPLHLQEDFCGTAFLSAEWLHSDPRRTAVGVDLDRDALIWCLHNNIDKLGSDGYSRISLVHGNVLKPLDENDLVNNDLVDKMERSVSLQAVEMESSLQVTGNKNAGKHLNGAKHTLQPRDIICAFNYSCCCLHRRADLLTYFKHALHALSREGGIFVMDLYGGASSERALKLQRRYTNFTYIWEQTHFDAISRTTRISLHFNFTKQRSLRHAFTYHWRLWTLAEIKDCLEEVGFDSVHFWIREMPNTSQNASEYRGDDNMKYEEVSTFCQRDAWNAYIVGVVRAKC
ncbi:uncharacterized protein LOC116246122 isoform X1 [Nymphaea colorata]|nr:uncharacterized protein LOC116246122 isoform X1 [Nymphaea colorata]